MIINRKGYLQTQQGRFICFATMGMFGMAPTLENSWGSWSCSYPVPEILGARAVNKSMVFAKSLYF